MEFKANYSFDGILRPRNSNLQKQGEKELVFVTDFGDWGGNTVNQHRH